MNGSIFRFTLDLQSVQSQVSIPVTRGDTARAWQISFSDGSLPFVLEDGLLAKLEIKRPTGTHMEEFCAIQERTNVFYPFAQNANTAAVEGVHECAVILYGEDGEIIASPRFTMIVSDRVIASDDVNLSDEDQTTIDGMVAAEASRVAAELGRINAEAEREAAEQLRRQTMETLQSMTGVTNPLPTVTEADEGKFLGIADGKYAFLPSIAGVEVNPEGEAADVITSLKVGGIIYSLPAGGSSAIAYEGEATVHSDKIVRIDGVAFHAEEGMTWSDWCASEHNTLGLTDYIYYIGGADMTCLATSLVGVPVLPTDTVALGGLYTLVPMEQTVSEGGEANG